MDVRKLSAICIPFLLYATAELSAQNVLSGGQVGARTVYRQQWSTKVYETRRNVYVPVTEYRWQSKWHGWLNPFQPAHVAYHLVPSTRWQATQQTIRTPVSRLEWVPQTATAQAANPTGPRTALRRLPDLTTKSPLVKPRAVVAERYGGQRLMEDGPPLYRRELLPSQGVIIK